MNSITFLTHILQRGGEIKTVRVSSAKARGKAAKYGYWGAARGHIALSEYDGMPCHYADERAPSARRAEHLAYRDAEVIAMDENRIPGGRHGRLTEAEASAVLDAIEHRRPDCGQERIDALFADIPSAI